MRGLANMRLPLTAISSPADLTGRLKPERKAAGSRKANLNAVHAPAGASFRAHTNWNRIRVTIQTDWVI